MTRRALLDMVILSAGVLCAAACHDAPSNPPGAAVGDTLPPSTSEQVGPAVAEPPRGPGCIRGGSTREEVRAIMGEPDSVSFGAWLYGRSSVTFGYGVVVDLSNEGGDLVLC